MTYGIENCLDCSSIRIRTWIKEVEAPYVNPLHHKTNCLWRQWESNPPHGECKSPSPSLGTFAPIIKRQQVIITFIITQLNDLYSCESVLKVFLGEEFVVHLERVEVVETSSLEWKSSIISHYTTPANLGRIRRVLSTETSSLISYLIRAYRDTIVNLEGVEPSILRTSA